MYTFSPTIAIVISMNWGNLFSSQVRDYHRKQTDPSPGFDIQCRLMGVNTHVEPNFSSPSIPWEEWMREKSGCYNHQHSDLISTIHSCSNAAISSSASLQSSLSSMKNILHLIQAAMLGYSVGEAAQACFCDRPHVTAAATHWHQGRSKVHSLLRIIRNQHCSYLYCCHACLIAARPESDPMHSPGYCTSYTTENFLYTQVVPLGHRISKQVVGRAKM